MYDGWNIPENRFIFRGGRQVTVKKIRVGYEAGEDDPQRTAFIDQCITAARQRSDRQEVAA